MPTTLSIPIAPALIPTWFGVGGGARRFAAPRTTDELCSCLLIDPALRVLGEGANLLVDDEGVDELVVRLNQGEFVACDDAGTSGGKALLRVGAGVNLFKLINETVRRGLGGLEVLAGIPASVGGAIVMNAGGAYGQVGDVVHRVFAIDRSGGQVVLDAQDIAFGYRRSGLGHLIVTGAELALTPCDAGELAKRKKEINDYKLRTQPMAANSAGCCFKNPTLSEAIDGIGVVGQRVSAGLLIDRAGLKGLTRRTAMVSSLHANFLVTTDRAHGRARDIIELMQEVESAVLARFGVKLDREVVVWSSALRPG